MLGARYVRKYSKYSNFPDILNVRNIPTCSIELWEICRTGLLDDGVDWGWRPTEEPVPYCRAAWAASWG